MHLDIGSSDLCSRLTDLRHLAVTTGNEEEAKGALHNAIIIPGAYEQHMVAHELPIILILHLSMSAVRAGGHWKPFDPN